MIRSHFLRPLMPVRGVGSVLGASATVAVATCSLVTLAPHTGARLDAALAFALPVGTPTGHSIVLRNLLTSR